jgi:hypothetical protein
MRASAKDRAIRVENKDLDGRPSSNAEGKMENVKTGDKQQQGISHDLMYSDKALRDAKWKEMKEQGAAGLQRYTVRGQRLHPMYVEDLRDTAEGRDIGLGNQAYKAFFGVLYVVEWEAR